ncbi:MAG TPA: hypothetical protein VKV28_11245 [Candidatus Binataceae bacterium]|nr:hypothetical protein [Candidatus Binataceae bacterium]
MKERSPKIQIVSHGPACFDGVVAAATVARFYHGYAVTPILAANQDSDRILQEIVTKQPGDEIWITDLSWNQVETAIHLRQMADAGARIFWIDHHRSALRRLGQPEFAVPFAGQALSEDYCASRLTFDFLNQRHDLPDSAARRQALSNFFPIVDLADDHDRWIHRLEPSRDWALAVQTLGGMESYYELLKLTTPTMSPALSQALESGRRAMSQSMDLARSTLRERALGQGLSLLTACCFGYSSEVAAAIYQDRTNAIVALLDMRSGGVSLRRSADCQADLSQIASALGGGGHAAASGFILEHARTALGAELSAVLGQSIERALRPGGHPAA